MQHLLRAGFKALLHLIFGVGFVLAEVFEDASDRFVAVDSTATARNHPHSDDPQRQASPPYHGRQPYLGTSPCCVPQAAPKRRRLPRSARLHLQMRAHRAAGRS